MKSEVILLIVVVHAIDLKKQKRGTQGDTKQKSVRRSKKHSRTSAEVQFKEFSLTKQKTRPGMNCKWIGKTT